MSIGKSQLTEKAFFFFCIKWVFHVERQNESFMLEILLVIVVVLLKNMAQKELQGDHQNYSIFKNVIFDMISL